MSFLQRIGRVLSLIDILSVVPSLGNQRIEDQRRLRQGKRIDILKLAKVQRRRSLFVAGRWWLRA